MTGWGGPAPDDARDEVQARNAIEQSDYLKGLIDSAIQDGAHAPVTPEMICELARLAASDECARPGVFREDDVEISGSDHVPPPSSEVAKLVDDMCREIEYASFQGRGGRAAYTLWRVNWIHPFEEGNGRTARAVAYFVICRAERVALPGNVTLPDLIRQEPIKYRRCLEEADRAWKRGKLNISGMTGFLERLLRAQLADVV